MQPDQHSRNGRTSSDSRERFAIIPASVLASELLTPTDVRMYGVIAMHDGGNGAWATLATLVRESNLKPRTAQRATANLAKFGFVEREIRRGQPTLYRVLSRPRTSATSGVRPTSPVTPIKDKRTETREQTEGSIVASLRCDHPLTAELHELISPLLDESDTLTAEHASELQRAHDDDPHVFAAHAWDVSGARHPLATLLWRLNAGVLTGEGEHGEWKYVLDRWTDASCPLPCERARDYIDA
jgi:hypothetical protein